MQNTHLENLKSVYFAGIGGVSMSSLALILKSKGIKVAGYDFKESETTKSLERQGIKVDYTYDTVDLCTFDTLCYTAAIKDDDPVMIKAKNAHLNIISRAHLLGLITGSFPHSVGIAGTHGKSTTTGLVSHIFLTAQKDATILSGAYIPYIESTYKIGKGDTALFEACEYKNSYHEMRPTVRVVLNVELDHVDFFENLENVIDSFKKFINTDSGHGENVAVINLDSKNALRASENAQCDVVYFSVDNKNADYYAENLDISTGFGDFDIVAKGDILCHVSLEVPGMHNVSNALAAAAAAHILGIDAQSIKDGLESFGGVKRRFEKIGTLPSGAVVIDDYAHHPDEIRATLTAAKKVCSGNVICVFQPHTFSRTVALMDDFVSALSLADKVICTKTFAAREKNNLGLSENALSDNIEGSIFAPEFSEAAAQALKVSSKGDMIITMGAGDVYKVSDYFMFA